MQYDPAAPVQQWLVWNIGDAMKLALVNQTPLSAALTSRNEGANGWAYFAKREFDSAKGPTACYAWSAPVLLSLTISPSTVAPGGTATATINLNGVGPGDNVPLYVWTSLDSNLIYTTTSSGPVTGLNHTFQINVATNSPTGSIMFYASLFPPHTYPINNYYFWFSGASLTVSTTGGPPNPPGGSFSTGKGPAGP